MDSSGAKGACRCPEIVGASILATTAHGWMARLASAGQGKTCSHVCSSSQGDKAQSCLTGRSSSCSQAIATPVRGVHRRLEQSSDAPSVAARPTASPGAKLCEPSKQLAAPSADGRFSGSAKAGMGLRQDPGICACPGSPTRNAPAIYPAQAQGRTSHTIRLSRRPIVSRTSSCACLLPGNPLLLG